MLICKDNKDWDVYLPVVWVGRWLLSMSLCAIFTLCELLQWRLWCLILLQKEIVAIKKKKRQQLGRECDVQRLTGHVTQEWWRDRIALLFRAMTARMGHLLPVFFFFFFLYSTVMRNCQNSFCTGLDNGYRYNFIFEGFFLLFFF